MSDRTPTTPAALLAERIQLPAAAARAVEARLHAPEAEPPPLPAGWRWQADGHGGWRLLSAPPGERSLPWAAGDRFGSLHLAARWEGPARRLVEAWCRLPDGGWLELAPRAGHYPLWGPSDVLRHHPGGPQPGAGREAGVMAAVNYAAPMFIPPFDRPAALPPGAGSAVLNFLAMLLELAGATDVPYRGPYPTRTLFGVLCRSFVPGSPVESARTLFTRDETALAFRAQMVENPVRWRPAPFAVAQPAPELTLHVRNGIETAWVRNVPFRPAPGTSGAMASGERVWVEGKGTSVGLALLGRPYCRFFQLDAEGRVVRAAALPGESRRDDCAAMAAPWREALMAWATLRAHAGLAVALHEAAEELALCWGEPPLRLAELDVASQGGPVLRVLAALGEEYRERAATEDAASLAMMLVSDVLEAATPPLLRWAQSRLEARTASERAPSAAELLATGEAAQQSARRTLETALPALVQALVRREALP